MNRINYDQFFLKPWWHLHINPDQTSLPQPVIFIQEGKREGKI